MATSFNDIVERFIPTVAEYSFFKLDDEELNELLKPYIISAATQFSSACMSETVQFDKESFEFSEDLSDEVIDILVDLVRVEWLKHKLYNADILKNGMSTKDYTIFSPANLQEQIRETYIDARNTAKMRLYQYSYTHPDSNIAGITI